MNKMKVFCFLFRDRTACKLKEICVEKNICLELTPGTKAILNVKTNTVVAIKKPEFTNTYHGIKCEYSHFLSMLIIF